MFPFSGVHRVIHVEHTPITNWKGEELRIQKTQTLTTHALTKEGENYFECHKHPFVMSTQIFANERAAV